ncbi:acyl-CoA dehydrogenase family protein, partial [Zhongshania sp.]|uniref:acyl-CoA dehydrogenase family protein n=1 Tax=Zhongshania sp. TaxID=1971902 RepID=UPI00356B07AD
MDTNFSPEDLAFRDQVRTFFQDEFTTELAARIATPTSHAVAIVEWQKILAKKGWIAPNWPVEHGGTGWSITQDYLFERERAAAGVPDVVPFGLKMVGQVIIAFGSDT